MNIHKSAIGLGDIIITFPFMIIGFVFEAMRLSFLVGRDRYIDYLKWLQKR